jgi:hypothetical protein
MASLGNLLWVIAIGALLFFMMRKGGGCCGGGHNDEQGPTTRNKLVDHKNHKGGCCG